MSVILNMVTVVCDECLYEEDFEDFDGDLFSLDERLKKLGWLVEEPSVEHSTRYEGNYHCCVDCLSWMKEKEEEKLERQMEGFNITGLNVV